MTVHKITIRQIRDFIKTMSPDDSVCIIDNKGEEDKPRDYDHIWINELCDYRAFDTKNDRHTINMPVWFAYYRGDKSAMMKQILEEELASVQSSTKSIIEDLDKGMIFPLIRRA